MLRSLFSSIVYQEQSVTSPLRMFATNHRRPGAPLEWNGLEWIRLEWIGMDCIELEYIELPPAI